MKAGSWASVTDIPCTCGYLEESAGDPNSPIRYDPDLNEYTIICDLGSDAQSHTVIYHCPFCGGTVPQSQRDKFFEALTDTEALRLRSLTRGIKSVEDALRILGAPSSDEPVKMPPRYAWPARRENKSLAPVRVLTYSGLSDVADVQILVNNDQTVEVTIAPKYLGPPKKGV